MNRINLDAVTIEDLMQLYEMKGICTVIENGKIIDFIA